MADPAQEQRDLFEQAIAPTPTEPEATPPTVEEPPAPAPAPAPVEETVPSWRLREEAEARRALEERSRMLEERLNQVTSHLQQQQKGKPDFFADPEGSVRELVNQAIGSYAEQNNRATMALGQMVARSVHGAEKVDAAEQAFLTAMNNRTLDPMEYEQVVQAPNRYDAVVQWHQRHSVMASVGTDPAAWFEKQLNEKLADPAFQASLLEKVRGSAAAKPTALKVPPSLSKATSAAGNGTGVEGDMSDASLWAHARRQ